MIREVCFRRFHEGWVQPTPEEVQELLAGRDMTDNDAAKLAGLGRKGSDASRQIRRYRSGERDIPYHVWRILVLELETQAALNAIPAGVDDPPAHGEDPDFDAGLPEDL